MAGPDQKSAKTNSPGSSPAQEPSSHASLPKSNLSQTQSPELSETLSQLSRLAEGLNSHVSVAGKMSSLVATLQRETKLLGGTPLIEKTNISSTSTKSTLDIAAISLKSLRDNRKT